MVDRPDHTIGGSHGTTGDHPDDGHGDHDMDTGYEVGTMDMSEHERTWEGFMSAFKVGSLLVGALVTWLVMVFAMGWGIFGSLFLVIAASVIIAILFG